MPFRQRDEPSSLSAASASSSRTASSVASTGVSPDATDTTPTTTVITKTETIVATATGSSTGMSSAISAGIGVGTGIAVAALILLLAAAVVFFRRRKRRHPDPAPPTPPTPIAETRSSVSIESMRPGLAAFLDSCRLVPRSSDVIEGQLSALSLFIGHHVQSHYHLEPALVRPETLHASLCQLQLSEATCCTVVRLSIDPKTRYVAIRHLLALVIFSNLDTHSVGCLSLLPPVLKEMAKSRPKAYKRNQDYLVETALVGWNRLTAFLMHKDPEDMSPVPLPPSIESQVKTLVTLLQEFLVHFARTDDDGSHGFQADLERIIGKCVKFGYEVFSDPCDLRLTFPQQDRGVVVMPGLERHSGWMVGELHDLPLIYLDPKVVTVDLMED